MRNLAFFNTKWVLFFIPLYFKWMYGQPSAGPSAKLPRPAFLLSREQVQNSSFRELSRSSFFYDFLEVLPRSHGELPRKLFGGVAWKCAGGLSVPPRENFASAKLPQKICTLLPKPYQNHCHVVFTTAQQVKKQVPPILGVNQRYNNQRHCNTFIRYL